MSQGDDPSGDELILGLLPPFIKYEIIIFDWQVKCLGGEIIDIIFERIAPYLQNSAAPSFHIISHFSCEQVLITGVDGVRDVNSSAFKLCVKNLNGTVDCGDSRGHGEPFTFIYIYSICSSRQFQRIQEWLYDKWTRA